jgi:hypothetical protein
MTGMTDASPGGRVALYRFYDAREDLLYAGISGDPWVERNSIYPESTSGSRG